MVFISVGLPTGLSNFKNIQEFDWLSTIALAKKLYGINILFKFHVTEDVRNSLVRKIVVCIVEKYLTYIIHNKEIVLFFIKTDAANLFFLFI